MSNSEQNPPKKEKRKHDYLFCVMSGIATAQAILILVVAIVITIMMCQQCNREQSTQTVAEVYQCEVGNGNPSDTSAVVVPLVQGPSQKVDDNSLDLESFGTGYMTILLSLITLCATLAVVIPYLVSKMYLESQVRENIKELELRLVEQNEGMKRRFQNDLESMKTEYSDYLDIEVAHNARMISFLLSNIKVPPKDSLKVNAWIIGWASKALLRYMSRTDSSYYNLQNFIENCIDYIIAAGKNISCPNPPKEGLDIILRAIVDLFDVCLLSEKDNCLMSPSFYQKQEELMNVGKTLCGCIGNDKMVISAICSKSKLREKDDAHFRSWVEEKLKSMNDSVVEQS